MSEGGAHQHGLLAGVGAGAMAVLVFGIGLLWMVWHRIAGPVGWMALIIVGAVTALAVMVAIYAGGRLLVLMLLHVREPETARFTIRRDSSAVNHTPAQPAMQSQPVAELGAGGTVIHNHFDGPGAAEAALRALRAPPSLSRPYPVLTPSGNQDGSTRTAQCLTRENRPPGRPRPVQVIG